MKTKWLAALLVILLIGGCEILGPDDDDKQTDRTYPAALNLPPGDLDTILSGEHPVGRFNLTAYVVGISECPPDHACLVADHIQVANDPHTDGIALMISAEKPSQFTQDHRYILSVEVFGDAFPETPQTRFVQLLAWSEAR